MPRHVAFCLSSHCFCLESQVGRGFLGGSLHGLSSCCRFLRGSRWLPVARLPGDAGRLIISWYMCRSSLTEATASAKVRPALSSWHSFQEADS